MAWSRPKARAVRDGSATRRQVWPGTRPGAAVTRLSLASSIKGSPKVRKRSKPGVSGREKRPVPHLGPSARRRCRAGQPLLATACVASLSVGQVCLSFSDNHHDVSRSGDRPVVRGNGDAVTKRAGDGLCTLLVVGPVVVDLGLRVAEARRVPLLRVVAERGEAVRDGGSQPGGARTVEHRHGAGARRVARRVARRAARGGAVGARGAARGAR